MDGCVVVIRRGLFFFASSQQKIVFSLLAEVGESVMWSNVLPMVSILMAYCCDRWKGPMSRATPFELLDCKRVWLERSRRNQHLGREQLVCLSIAMSIVPHEYGCDLEMDYGRECRKG